MAAKVKAKTRLATLAAKSVIFPLSVGPEERAVSLVRAKMAKVSPKAVTKMPVKAAKMANPEAKEVAKEETQPPKVHILQDIAVRVGNGVTKLRIVEANLQEKEPQVWKKDRRMKMKMSLKHCKA